MVVAHIFIIHVLTDFKVSEEREDHVHGTDDMVISNRNVHYNKSYIRKDISYYINGFL